MKSPNESKKVYIKPNIKTDKIGAASMHRTACDGTTVSEQPHRMGKNGVWHSHKQKKSAGKWKDGCSVKFS